MKQHNKYREEFRCHTCDSLLGKYDSDSAYFMQIKCHQRNCKTLNNEGNHQPDEIVEFRCTAVDPKKSAKAGHDVVCNKLLAKIAPGTKVNIRCPRCGAFISSDGK
jgi:phage FluMu protein Com